MRKILMATALAIGATSFAATPATSQVQVPSGLVNVTVGDVILENILNDNEIELLNNLDLLNDNQIVVQVPVSVAANVCNVAVNVLARSGPGADCTAESGSDALARVIRQRIRQAQRQQ